MFGLFLGVWCSRLRISRIIAALQQIDSDSEKYIINFVSVAQKRIKVERILVVWHIREIHFTIFLFIITWTAVSKMVTVRITTAVFLMIPVLLIMAVAARLPKTYILLAITETRQDCAVSWQYILLVRYSCKFSWYHVTTILSSHIERFFQSSLFLWCWRKKWLLTLYYN